MGDRAPVFAAIFPHHLCDLPLQLHEGDAIYGAERRHARYKRERLRMPPISSFLARGMLDIFVWAATRHPIPGSVKICGLQLGIKCFNVACSDDVAVFGRFLKVGQDPSTRQSSQLTDRRL